jgi:hypothetical protein
MSEMATDQQADLEARAQANAQIIEGWNVEKQRQYEQFMAAEKAAEARRQANVQHPDLQPEPVHEIEKIDPWGSYSCECCR